MRDVGERPDAVLLGSAKKSSASRFECPTVKISRPCTGWSPEKTCPQPRIERIRRAVVTTRNRPMDSHRFVRPCASSRLRCSWSGRAEAHVQSLRRVDLGLRRQHLPWIRRGSVDPGLHRSGLARLGHGETPPDLCDARRRRLQPCGAHRVREAGADVRIFNDAASSADMRSDFHEQAASAKRNLASLPPRYVTVFAHGPQRRLHRHLTKTGNTCGGDRLIDYCRTTDVAFRGASSAARSRRGSSRSRTRASSCWRRSGSPSLQPRGDPRLRRPSASPAARCGDSPSSALPLPHRGLLGPAAHRHVRDAPPLQRDPREGHPGVCGDPAGAPSATGGVKAADVAAALQHRSFPVPVPARRHLVLRLLPPSDQGQRCSPRRRGTGYDAARRRLLRRDGRSARRDARCDVEDTGASTRAASGRTRSARVTAYSARLESFSVDSPARPATSG